MAERKANIIISAINKAKAVFADVNNGIKSIDKASKEANASIGSMLAGFLLSPITLMIAALGSLTSVLKGASSEAAKQELALNRLSASMKNNGTYTKTAFDAAVKFTDQLQATTTVSDELAQSSMALINSLTGLSGEKLNAITLAAVDLAAGLQQLNGGELDVEGASKMLAKAFVGSAAALQKQGIIVTGAAGTMERLNSITEEVAKKFGGRATAETNTFAGSVKQLKNNFGELLEGIGQTENLALLPFIKSLNSALVAIKNLSANKKVEVDFSLVGADFGKTLQKDLDLSAKKIVDTKKELKSLGIDENKIEGIKTGLDSLAKLGLKHGLTKKQVLVDMLENEKAHYESLKEKELQYNSFLSEKRDSKGKEELARLALLRIKNEEQLKDAIEKNELANAKTSASRELSTQEQIDSIKKILDATNIDVEGRSALLIRYYGLKAQLNKDGLKDSIEKIDMEKEKLRQTRDLQVGDEIQFLDRKLSLETISQDERSKLILDREKLLADKRLGNEKNFQQALANLKNSFDDLQVIATVTKSKELFDIAKVGAIATATMDAYAAFNKSLASTPWPFNLIGAGAALAAGLANVSNISSIVPKFADGGIVGGNSPSGDRIPALLNSGEEVLTKNDRERIRNILPTETRPIEKRPTETRPIIIQTVIKIGEKEFARAVSDSINLQKRGLL